MKYLGTLEFCLKPMMIVCYVPRVLFEIDDDCHVPIKTKRAFNKNYIQYESNNGKYKNL